MSVLKECPIFPITLREGGSTTLFCIPSAGSSAAMYAPWIDAAPSEIQVCPVEYPGHGARIQEDLQSDPAVIAKEIAQAIVDSCEGNIALFGHSIGAAIVWRIVQELQFFGAKERLKLIVLSGRPETAFMNRRGPRHLLNEAEFIHEVKYYGGLPEELLADDEFLAFFLPILRNDFHLAFNLENDPSVHVDVPLMTFAGAQDPDTGIVSMKAWQSYSSVYLGHFELDGGHFYLNTPANRNQILALIARNLQGANR